jgi:prevent-host-death family protein
MEKIWKLQEAKNQFSKVVNDALEKGPQYIARRGTKTVVVLSVDEYEKMTSDHPDFKTFLLNCPKMGEDFIVERKKDYPRSIDL